MGKGGAQARLECSLDHPSSLCFRDPGCSFDLIFTLQSAPTPAGDNIRLNKGTRTLLSGRAALHLLQQLLMPQIIARRLFFKIYLFFKRNSVGLRLGWPPILHTHMRKT